MLNTYSDKITEELMEKMIEFLKEHTINELLALLAGIIPER